MPHTESRKVTQTILEREEIIYQIFQIQKVYRGEIFFCKSFLLSYSQAGQGQAEKLGRAWKKYLATTHKDYLSSVY